MQIMGETNDFIMVRPNAYVHYSKTQASYRWQHPFFEITLQ